MKKILFLNLFFCFVIGTLLTSCVSKKQIAYFQKSPGEHDTIGIAKAYIPKIQPGDILAINIGSLNPAASSFFNPYPAVPANSGSSNLQTDNSNPVSALTSQAAIPNYLINTDGTTDIPIVGNVKLEGLTTIEARDLIKARVTKYLKDPTVNVRLTNYKISIMGEVTRPSVYVIPNEKITLPEALSLAGDLTIFGKRDDVLIVRDVDGKKEFGRINLNNREIYSSPYYYLHNNDIIYVEPNKGKIAQSDKFYQILPVMLSALSFLTIIISTTRR